MDLFLHQEECRKSEALRFSAVWVFDRQEQYVLESPEDFTVLWEKKAHRQIKAFGMTICDSVGRDLKKILCDLCRVPS